jgi:hemerythrin
MSTVAARSGVFAWNSSLQVGVRVIDSQHMRLVAMINNLHDAVLFGGGRREAMRILDDLMNYTQYHFTLEERLMAQHGYPGATVHQRDHASLTAQVRTFVGRYEDGDAGASQELQDFLRQWLSSHVMGADKHLGAFLVNLGMH